MWEEDSEKKREKSPFLRYLTTSSEARSRPALSTNHEMRLKRRRIGVISARIRGSAGCKLRAIAEEAWENDTTYGNNTGDKMEVLMAAKKVDALEECLEGEMSQMKATVEDKISSVEDNFRSS
ncbi:hypothetical protein MA16_Dca027022 [Dendrobium catenatum]|uniref:Uncharacterized protein n=1 Tax=Dendrobium catenatum TaxID=906689 RepID=A0A2I0WRK8_9ASPA|nr:hypothetical protein MA16_Dca027022 [Dendrobium catenatum]